jgi:glycosyltransferase involved in cell wall biosynthesis
VAVRVLIIDDASSDDTATIGERLAVMDARVEFRRHVDNKGHIATYNEGLLQWATAKYVVLLSADDLLTPGSLHRAAQIMDRDETIGMVYGRVVWFERNTDIPRITGNGKGYSQWSGNHWLERRCRTGHNVISSPEVVVRRSVQRQVGGYREDLPHAGDLEMWLRIAAVSNVAYVRGVPQACYRVHRASMARTQYRGKLADLEQRKAAFDAFFERYVGVPNSISLHRLANRALAREAIWEACRAYDRDEVEEVAAGDLVRFGLTTYPDIVSESEYKALGRRRRLGSFICNRTQIFILPAIVRRVRGWLYRERWRRQGV